MRAFRYLNRLVGIIGPHFQYHNLYYGVFQYQTLYYKEVFQCLIFNNEGVYQSHIMKESFNAIFFIVKMSFNCISYMMTFFNIISYMMKGLSIP